MINLESPSLFDFINNNDINNVKEVLKSGSDVNQKKDWSFPLHHAINNDSKDIIKLLLDYGADVNCKGNVNRTPLIQLIKNSFHDFFDAYMFENNTYNYKEQIILCLQKINNILDIISLLHEYKAQINIEDLDGNAPLMLAINAKNLYFVLKINNLI